MTISVINMVRIRPSIGFNRIDMSVRVHRQFLFIKFSSIRVYTTYKWNTRMTRIWYLKGKKVKPTTAALLTSKFHEYRRDNKVIEKTS